MNARLKKIRWIGIVITISIVVLAYVILDVLDKKTDSIKKQNILTILEITRTSMGEWLSLNKKITAYHADTSIVKNTVNALLNGKNQKKNLQQKKIRGWYEGVRLKHEYLGFFVIDRNGNNIASSRDSNLGARSLLVEDEGLLEEVFAGKVVVSAPIITDVPLLMNGKELKNIYSVFIVAPVLDVNGNIVAAFAFRINPYKELSYFIDVATRNDGVNVVLVNRNFKILNFMAGKNVELILKTAVVSDALRILNDEHYRQEHAVLLSEEFHDDIIGATVWDAKLNMGLFAYMDSDIAHEDYTHIKWTVLIFSTSIILLVWVVLWNINKSQFKLSKNKEWLESIFNSIPLTICVFDKSGSIKFANKNIEVLDEYRNHTSGRNSLNVKRHLHGANHWYDSLLENIWGPWCVKYVSGDEHEIIVNFEHVRIKDQDGEFVDLVVANDVTGYVSIEMEKTSLLKQLQQSQKMEAIGQLTGGIAHDFNNMLAAIMGYTELSLEYCSDDKLKEYLIEVERAGRRAQTLVQQMLAYSRKNGSAQYHVDPVKTLNESLSLLKSTIPSSIEIVKKLPAHEVEIIIDPIQLQQMIMNLVINSRDAINEKGTVVCSIDEGYEENILCSSCFELFSGKYISITIQDTGEGIDATNLAKIFEPFYTSKEVGKGSGMGLSMVHGIMHSVGGHIIVNSKPGLGTEVVLLFPEIIAKKYYAQQKTA